jgi:hypothetical protein
VASGRGTLRIFSERDLIALRLAKEVLDAGHRLGPFMHVLRFVQHGRGLPPIDQLEGKLLVSNGSKVRVVDGATSSLSETLEPRSVLYVIDLGAAARHVRRGIERIEQKSGKHKGERVHSSAA